MNGNPRIGQSAPISRVRVGQYISFGNGGPIYKVVKSYNSLPESTEHVDMLRFRPTKFDRLTYNSFPVSDEFTQSAYLAKLVGTFNPTVTVVAKPKKGEGFLK